MVNAPSVRSSAYRADTGGNAKSVPKMICATSVSLWCDKCVIRSAYLFSSVRISAGGEHVFRVVFPLFL